jgi:hypothetical protein
MEMVGKQQKCYGTAREVAEMFRTSPAMVYTWTREGKFPAGCIFRIGKKLLFDLSELECWAARGGSMARSEGSDVPV